MSGRYVKVRNRCIMATNLYSTPQWRRARAAAVARDAGRCTVSRLLGGDCAAGPVHVHHIHAVNEGGAAFDLDNLGTTCSAHHPVWESLRRILARRMLADQAPRCAHYHASAEARRLCERRLARRARVAA